MIHVQSPELISLLTAIRRIQPGDTVPLRHSVLWPDRPVSDVLLKDDIFGEHYGAFLKDDVYTLVAVVSVFDNALPQPMPDGVPGCVPALRFRKFACDPAHQGKGIGTRLLQHAFSAAPSDLKVPARVIWCDARLSKAGWYERKEIGMERFGETFFKSGVEYVRMRRVLTEDSEDPEEAHPSGESDPIPQ